MKDKTIDELESIKHNVNLEIIRRNQEPTKGIFITRLNDSNKGATFYKKYEDAKKGFDQEVDFSTLECWNKMSIEYKEIPETEYNLRPDTWYS